MKTIYLAGGCFWGTEAYFSRIPGVTATSVGYANGLTDTTTYERIGETDHAETVCVTYDEARVSLRQLLLHYFRIIDPFSVNRQGNDVGRQYRTGIYYIDEADRPVILEIKKEVEEKAGRKCAVETERLHGYIPAEEYHQEYLKKHPNGYCHIDIGKAEEPVIDEKKYVRPTTDMLREKLTPLSYAVTQEGATEPSFNNPYHEEFRKGIYVDITTGEPLFLSRDKFESGCGWPAFSKPISAEVANYDEDRSLPMTRIEVRSRAGHAHLGHVFQDGPTETGGLRYCINSAALRFIPKEEMEAAGYGELIPYVE